MNDNPREADLPALNAEDYPSLARVWDNPADAAAYDAPAPSQSVEEARELVLDCIWGVAGSRVSQNVVVDALAAFERAVREDQEERDRA